MEVKAWKELVTIPTYKIGEPDKNPMFLEKRVYQGSSGVVYPHPVIDKVYDEKEDKQWIALFLENEYIKVMILPELGGRIQMAYDKTNDYHFIYYNNVIKPALVGLAGPWISGGIEFNWPQHHRPSTFGPTDFTIEENEDGSKTVWVNEYEVMFRTRCSLGFTLHEGKAYIELHSRLFNRTPFPQSFLWWANPAVAVDEHYQSVFPPDVHAVYDHGKRDVSSFPIATGTYYKVDYSPGTDISVYTNIPVPTSYMAMNSAYDFVGGYHHQKKAGLMHVANHHVSPGKKQWTWGCGEFGKAWDKQLTDNDGPYFELMCGMYTDNQPDFSWIMPNEVREFKQYFMPYKDIGYVKNASVDAMVNFEITGQSAAVSVYLTQKQMVTILVKKNDSSFFERRLELSPKRSFHEVIRLKEIVTDPQTYSIEVRDEKGILLIGYTPEPGQENVLPDPAKPIAAPQEIDTIESLYLAGLHLEQYRHASFYPEQYYEEALRRDPSDSRSNNAMGLLFLRRGEYNRSEPFFQAAIDKLKRHNPNPYDCEPLYNLGLALACQHRYKEAFDHFYKATWTVALQDMAFFQLASIETINNNWTNALDLVGRSLNRNQHSPQAKHLKTIILRSAGRSKEALVNANEALAIDAFDFGNHYEQVLLLSALGKKQESADTLDALKLRMNGIENNYIEISLDYARVHDYAAAFGLLDQLEKKNASPIVYYYLGYYQLLAGNTAAAEWFDKGSAGSPARVFPNRLEDVDVLNVVLKQNPTDYKALYYLGNFYYAKRRYEDAKNCWERSVAINGGFPTSLRNLGIAYFNKFDRKEKALELFEKAYAADPTDSRVLYELDQLYKLNNKPPEERLSWLRDKEDLIADRDDLYIEYVALQTLTNNLERAKELMKRRNFHPWEGGEGRTSGQHIHIHIELAKQALGNADAEKALALLLQAKEYPETLGEGKLFGAQENDIDYWLGCVYQELNNAAQAREYWKKASIGSSEPQQAVFYNDQQPDKIFYQGLALLKLSQEDEAKKRFGTLIKFGEANMDKEVKMDFFAVSHPDLLIFDDNPGRRNNIHCFYLQGLGYLGLNEREKAEAFFQAALALDASHIGATIHKRLLHSQDKKIRQTV